MGTEGPGEGSEEGTKGLGEGSEEGTHSPAKVAICEDVPPRSKQV